MKDSAIAHSVRSFQKKSDEFLLKTENSKLKTVLRIPDINKDFHCAAADHSLFAGFVRRETEFVQGRRARSQGFSRFGPDLGFDAAAADRARNCAVLEKEHLRAAPLRRRAARVRHARHHHALASPVR